MKQILISVLFLLSPLFSQFQSPVTLSAKIESNARAGEVAKIVVTAEMDSEWKIYALRNQGEGPIATRVTVLGDIIKDSGLVEEDEPIEKYDDGFLTETKTHPVSYTHLTLPTILRV